MAKRKKSYRVGYKRPPREGRFRPGTSGNPRGRPKGSGRLGKVARREAARRITYVENGVRKEIRTDEAIVRQALVNAAKGDYRAIPVALRLLDQEEPDRDEPNRDEIFDQATDHLVVADIVRRIRATVDPLEEPAKDQDQTNPKDDES